MATNTASREETPECPLHLVLVGEQTGPVALSESAIHFRAWHEESANTTVRRRPTVPAPAANDERCTEELILRTADELRAAGKLLGRALFSYFRSVAVADRSAEIELSKKDARRQALAKAHGQLVGAFACQRLGDRQGAKAIGNALYAADNHASYFESIAWPTQVRHAAENYRRALREVLRYCRH